MPIPRSSSWYRSLCWLIALLWCGGVWGVAQPALWLQHQSWSTEAGLPQSSVHQILQTRDGYLWLATEGGAARYDGVSFRAFTHERDAAFTSNDVTSLAEDGGGALWFGTADGLVRRDRGGLRRFGEPDGLPSSSVLGLSVAMDGLLVAVTAGGTVRFDGERFMPAASKAESALVGMSGATVGGAMELPGGGRCVWTDREVVVETAGRRTVWRAGGDLPGVRVRTVLVGGRGTVWIGTNRGLASGSATTGQVGRVAALGENSILSLLEDTEGDLWIGTETSGLHALRPRAFREEPGVAEDEVSALVQAADGTIWLGTREDGLRHLAAGFGGAMRALPVGNWELTSPVILSLAAGAQGDVWAGTPDGLNHVDADGKVTRYTSSEGLPDDLVRSLVRGRDGTVWIGTRRGLGRLREGRLEAMGGGTGLIGGLIGTMNEAGGDLWVGTLAGLSRLRGGTVTNFGRNEGLASALVTGIAPDQAGRLWVATQDAGLFLFGGERFSAVGAAGLPTEMESLAVDRMGFLWMRTRDGVIRGGTDELAHCAGRQGCTAAVGRYGLQDGLPSGERVAHGEPQMALAATGTLWVATRKGVGLANTADLPHNAVPPPVAIERFVVDEEEIPVGAGMQRIANGHGRYTFQFAGLSLMLPAKVRYRTRLEGFDRAWSAAGASRETTYTSLPAGAYTFRVQAMNNDGVWNGVGASLAFRVLPPVYRRWWFVLLAGLLVALIGAGLYRLRVRRLQGAFDAVLAERTRIAREIHDTLAQDMVGTTLQLDLISQMLAGNQTVEAAAQVRATRTMVKAGLESARQSIWNLRADAARETLPTRVKAVAAGLPEGAPPVSTNIGGAYRALGNGVEDEVVRVVQEGLANVRRHAGAKEVKVELRYGQDKLVVTIEDDGVGFVPGEARPGHFGLQGMRERASAVGGRLEVVSSPGAGTRVELTVWTAPRKGSMG